MDNDENKNELENSKDPSEHLKKKLTSNEEPVSSLDDTSPNKGTEGDNKKFDGDERHPTGNPESTAGWFSEDVSNLENDQAENTNRFPEGDDESTESVNSINEIEPSENEKDQSDTVAISQDELDQTIASKPDNETTKPKKNNEGSVIYDEQGYALFEEEIERTPPRPIKAYTPPVDQKETIPPPHGATQPILPNRINVNDTQATRVSPVAYQTSQQTHDPRSQQEIKRSGSFQNAEDSTRTQKASKKTKPPKDTNDGGFRQA
ncbi:MAG TPA: hypothetical protein VK856_14990, partial [Anaerolineaceae bacterium]|nr:hypothetical protein [Anaerolineaceae bacterium]